MIENQCQGKSLGRAAKQLGIPQSRLSSLIHGKIKRPQIPIMYKIAKFLGIEDHAVFYEEND